MTFSKKRKLLSVDIGSTWTKGALFELDENDVLHLAGNTQLPTSVDDLHQAFDQVAGALTDGEDVRTLFSSSAKGGLAIAALGIVPDLTLKVAKSAALSAGAKVCGIYAYKLNTDDLAKLNSPKIDIVLFSGGTDGGNEQTVLHNTKMLSNLNSGSTIIYAGNHSLAPEISRILGNQQLVITANILPELDNPQTEGVNQAIRKVFFDKIVHGKGLDTIESRCSSRAMPTPAAIFEFCKLLAEQAAGSEFGLLDLGGATTDFYSCCEALDPDSTVVFKGVPEPFSARTVEGDLGLRVSAESVFGEEADAELAAYINKVSGCNEYLAESDEEREFDRRMARKCCVEAIFRHAGSIRTFYSASGNIQVQKGRDLRKLKVIIATGGYFTQLKTFDLNDAMNNEAALFPHKLVPRDAHYLVDKSYLMIHLANIAREYPQAAIQYAQKYFEKIGN